ncbi:uncharacterized protein ARMOST_20669 [Armillaria ostoyae]|uniref:Uncharacterized protein n=1 Tax=Armillaria ostoyae TaxID=47428 RepID=A0A284S7Y7_ARMOS|nr:uncharacterized protein ARMOST_20669 [Armillaria ostoyae]
MTAGTYPGTAIPELTDSQIKDIFEGLDANLNDAMLTAFLYGQQIYCHTTYFSNQCFEGIYTGVVAVTLWAVASRNNCPNSRQSHLLVFIILLLYLLRAYGFYCEWEQDLLYFITANEKTFWEAFESNNLPITVTLTIGIDATLSTVLADATLAWDPMLFACLLAHGFLDVALLDCLGSVMARRVCSDRLHRLGDSRGIVNYYEAFEPIVPPRAMFLENMVSWSVLYSSLILATLLWCTILIIYRILKVGAAAGRMYVYQRVIEMLVESASLYSAVIVVLLVFEARNEVAGIYIENLANAMRGIVPTILVGRVAAGHARPDDSWTGSTVSSLQFRARPSAQDDSGRSAEWAISTESTRDLEEGLEVGRMSE